MPIREPMKQKYLDDLRKAGVPERAESRRAPDGCRAQGESSNARAGINVADIRVEI